MEMQLNDKSSLPISSTMTSKKQYKEAVHGMSQNVEHKECRTGRDSFTAPASESRMRGIRTIGRDRRSLHLKGSSGPRPPCDSLLKQPPFVYFRVVLIFCPADVQKRVVFCGRMLRGRVLLTLIYHLQKLPPMRLQSWVGLSNFTCSYGPLAEKAM